MSWDINVRYDGNYIYYLFGDYTINYQQVSLLDQFNGWAYLGWSGFTRGNRKLEMREAYICEDVNYKEVKVSMAKNFNNNFETEVTASPNQIINMKFDFYSRNIVSPHMLGETSEFNLNVSTECGTWSGLQVQDRFVLVGDVSF